MARLASLPLHCYSTQFPYKGGQVIILITSIMMPKWFSLLLCCCIVKIVNQLSFNFNFFFSLFFNYSNTQHVLHILSTYDISKVLLSEEDLKLPKELHPIFYGCFDWHRSIGSMLGFQFYVSAHAFTPQKNCHFPIKLSTALSMDIGCWLEQLLCFRVCF